MTSFYAARLCCLLPEVPGNEPLDNNDIAPDTVQLPMLLVHANLTEAEFSDEAAAGMIFDENAGEQFPKSVSLRSFDERGQRQASGAPPTRGSSDVKRRLGDACVTLSRTI